MDNVTPTPKRRPARLDRVAAAAWPALWGLAGGYTACLIAAGVGPGADAAGLVRAAVVALCVAHGVVAGLLVRAIWRARWSWRGYGAWAAAYAACAVAVGPFLSPPPGMTQSRFQTATAVCALVALAAAAVNLAKLRRTAA